MRTDARKLWTGGGVLAALFLCAAMSPAMAPAREANVPQLKQRAVEKTIASVKKELPQVRMFGDRLLTWC